MNAATMTYGALFVAIIFEVAGTTLLQKTEQFTRLIPTISMALCYVVSFYFLSVTLRTMPIGLAYAIWSALGIVLISVIGYVVFRQSLDMAAIIGLGFIVAGVVIVNTFSSSISH
jgi:Membrane transporters of cations and cationic drugs